MESIKADDIRPTDFGRVLFSKKQTITSRKSGWELAVFIVVAFLHVGLVDYWFQWQEPVRRKADVLQDSLEITFIERISTTKPVASSSQSNKNKTANKFRLQPSEDTVDMPLQVENSDEVSPASLRLTLDNSEWNSLSVIEERNPLKRQHIALAGRAEPFVQGIKLRNKLSPRQKLAMVGKLFGAVEYDPCAEARKRLASGQSQLNEMDLEADLGAIEKHCRP